MNERPGHRWFLSFRGRINPHERQLEVGPEAEDGEIVWLIVARLR